MIIDSCRESRAQSSARRSGAIKLVIVCVLAAISIVVIAFWLVPSSSPQKADEQEAVRFVERLRSGDIDAAWEETSSEFKSFIGRDRLHRTVKTTAAFKHPFELDSQGMIEVGPLQFLECLFQSTKFSGIKLRILLAPNRNGPWQVERFEVLDSR